MRFPTCRIGRTAFLAVWLCVAAVACSAPAEQPTALPTSSPTPEPTPTPALTTEERLAQTDPPARNLAQIARRMGTPVAESPATPSSEATAYQIGDRMEFWVLATPNNTYRRASATLQAGTPHVYMWLEDGETAAQQDLQASAEYFETHIYPTLHRVMGRERSPGIDGDPHLFVFNGDVLGAGYFYSLDEYPAEANPYSNQHEIFFVNVKSARPGTQAYNALLAHEFQHMIHWHNDPNEDAWVNEGLSELAVRVAGLPVASAPSYARSPDIQLNDWPVQGRDTGPHYGGAYLLMEYLQGRFGEGFLQQVVSEPRNGIAGIERVLEQHGADFDSVFRDWTVANLLNDDRLAGGVYGYPNIHAPTPEIAYRVDSLPATITDTVHPFGADYIQIPPSESVLVEFQGPAHVALAEFAASPGEHFWWSGRGDNSDMTLTREVDLTKVSRATLHASLWYEIEDGWDFAYLSVSTDGGDTWLPQAGQHTRMPAPGDSMLGPGYTGVSGGGSEPAWIEESYSLDAFAGQDILARFEYITDDGVNLDGFWIRGLEIPEIGWRDEAEGWQAEGFVRVENVVPQRFLLTAVLHGPETEVLPIEVNADGKASVHLSAPHGATLIVSSVARHTRQAASYQLRVEPAQ